MASLKLAAANVFTRPGPLPAFTRKEMLCHSLSAAGNLAHVILPSAGSRSINTDNTVSVTLCARRGHDFDRRDMRFHAYPRNDELATIRSVPVQVARELLNAGHRYLDVRTAEEFAAGHVKGAVNVPYFKQAGGGMTKNLHFVEDVGRIFDKDDELVVGCQSGRRSMMAATDLQNAEYSGVTDMMGGYQAWVSSGLPL